MRGNERWHESDNDGKFSGLLQLMSVKALGLTHSTLQSILAIARKYLTLDEKPFPTVHAITLLGIANAISLLFGR
jgi:hypothetical protein